MDAIRIERKYTPGVGLGYGYAYKQELKDAGAPPQIIKIVEYIRKCVREESHLDQNCFLYMAHYVVERIQKHGEDVWMINCSFIVDDDDSGHSASVSCEFGEPEDGDWTDIRAMLQTNVEKCRRWFEALPVQDNKEEIENGKD